MSAIFKNKTILVTGGAGSIGSEIVRGLLKNKPRSVRVFDSREEGLFWLSQEFKNKPVELILGDVRDRIRVSDAVLGADIVFHAAALKHVSFCEAHPSEAVVTNIVGTQHVVEAALHHNVPRLIGISTDKAAKPTNVMGATKFLSEKIITSVNGRMPKTAYACVRFGNVLDSSGSLIPILRAQIEKGDTVTITDKEMTRFFMSIPDAVRFIFAAAEAARGGEVFIPRMFSLRLIDLVEVIVEEFAPRYGKDPKKITYTFIGARPGERLHEPLVSFEEAKRTTTRDSMFVVHPANGAHGAHNKNPKEYNSGTTPPLSKGEIKELLSCAGVL